MSYQTLKSDLNSLRYFEKTNLPFTKCHLVPTNMDYILPIRIVICAYMKIIVLGEKLILIEKCNPCEECILLMGNYKSYGYSVFSSLKIT